MNDDSHITVDRDELVKSLAIWITVLPPFVIRNLIKSMDKGPRDGADDRVRAARHALAGAIADSFKRSKWEVVRQKQVGDVLAEHLRDG